VVQSFYNKMKPGVEGVTHYAFRLQWEHTVGGTKGLKRVFMIASFIACRPQRKREDIYNSKNYDGLRLVATQAECSHDDR
jgi:hypothetical protein